MFILYLILIEFAQNSLKAFQMHFDNLSKLHRSCSLYRNNLNELQST